MRGGKVILYVFRATVVVLLTLVLPWSARGSAVSASHAGVCAADGSDDDGRTELRSRIYESQRRAKADSLRPPEQNALEKGLLFFETGNLVDKLRYGYHGFFLKFGGLSTRSGFALGLRYQNDEIVKASSLYASFTLSANMYQRYQAGVTSRPVKRLPVSLGLDFRYRNYPREEFYGIGPNSLKSDRSNFRREDFDAAVSMRARPVRGVGLGVRAGYLRSRTGAGGGGDVPSLDEVFHSESVVGFLESIDYETVGFTGGVDYRDSGGNPRSGISLLFEHTLYDDRSEDKYSFQASSAEFQGYLPFLHKHRVIALRAYASEAKGRAGGVVPFDLLPYVGGGDTMRGYEEYRLRDGKLLLGNIEYRFEAFIGLDVAVFGDFGQVGGDWADFRTSEFKWSYGGGLRFNTAYSVFMRLDVGYGKEGAKFYWKFENVF